MKQPPDRPPDLLILDLSVGYRFQPGPQPAGRRPCRALAAPRACPVRRSRASWLAAPAGRVRHEGVSHDR